MPTTEDGKVYYDLVVIADSPATDIWLGDDDGHLVQKETGTLGTSVSPGYYTVEFGLGSAPYAIHLTKDSRYTETELAAGPTCVRPIPKLLSE